MNLGLIFVIIGVMFSVLAVANSTDVTNKILREILDELKKINRN